ncbi:hypothetical protein K440DRAFT_608786 [Wilcoxina mikolae CBS 423.85]|nr:hypothetical protein K440DRAFT_608786 [Wilcoxina mikolae CBS 423.85]
MYSTHVIVATGETDWIRDVDQINGSLMQTLAMFSGQVRNGRMMISASNISPPQECHIPHGDGNTQPTALIILPSFIVLDHVHPEDAEAVIERFVNQCPTTSEPLFHKNQNMLALTTSATSENYVASSPAFDVDVNLKPATLPICPSSTLKSRPYPHDYLILICSHHRRDARCGISAPILRKEFEKHLRLLNLWRDLNDERPGGARVVFINHIGGHKYAANVILYRKADGQGIWLARVAPKHVEGIVKYTLLQGKIVYPDMMRGGFNRSTGMTSW